MALLSIDAPGCRTGGFLQGAAGNLNPVRGDSRDYRDVQLYGTMVGGEALKVAAGLLGDDSTASRSGTVAWAAERVMLPPRPLPDREPYEARLEGAEIQAAGAIGAEARQQAEAELRRAREAVQVWERYSETQEAEVQVSAGHLAIAEPGRDVHRVGPAHQAGVSGGPHTFVSRADQ